MEFFFGNKISLTLGLMERILLIQTSFIGDVILASALLEDLHIAFPDTKIDLLLRKGNESLFKGHPFLGHLYVWDKNNDKYRGLWKLLKEVRSKKYDLLINLQRFASTGLFTVLSAARETRGFIKNPFSFLFHKKVAHTIGDGTHEIERNRFLVDDLCSGKPSRPRLYPNDFDLSRTPLKKEFVCMAPNSVWFTKMLPHEKWVELIRELPENIDVALLGAPSEHGVCEKIIKQLEGRSGLYNLCGKLSLLESAALMKSAKMNYVNDSAPLHLCTAVNAPQLAFFCSTSPSFGFTPLSEKSFILEADIEPTCKPCGLHGKKACPKGHFDCGDINMSKAVQLAMN
jgi:ADP-heptose:LPS heptosyltransferase